MYSAGTFSRAPQPTTDEAPDMFKVFAVEVYRVDTTPPKISSTTLCRLQEETKQDAVLKQLSSLVFHGWPALKQDTPSIVSPYWTYRDELLVHDGVVFKGQQAVLPRSMQKEMLCKLHTLHQGSESCLRHAKEFLFLQGMAAAIKDICANCSTRTAHNSTQHAKQPMLSHNVPLLPWQYVSQDLFSAKGYDYLITVDHYSDFLEITQLNNTTAARVVEATKSQFARHGIPQTVVTDNNPQFVSAEYGLFATSYDFVRKTSSLYYSRGNGKAESAIKIAKAFLKKADDPWLAILDYRNTPTQGQTASSAQRLMSRRTRGLLPADCVCLNTPNYVLLLLQLQLRTTPVVAPVVCTVCVCCMALHR